VGLESRPSLQSPQNCQEAAQQAFDQHTTSEYDTEESAARAETPKKCDEHLYRKVRQKQKN
jgi:hypothetical protein